MGLKDLIGKTILSVEDIKFREYDDIFTKIIFNDGTSCYLFGNYGDYTGESLDEYPTYVDIKMSLEDAASEIGRFTESRKFESDE